MGKSRLRPSKSVLAALCRQKKSLKQMADQFKVAPSTIGWWLGHYKLQTAYGTQPALVRKPKCTACGTTNPTHFYYGRKSTCVRCWNKRYKHCKNPRRKDRRTMLKYAAVQAKGGCCQRCGYKKNLAALQFHHPNSDEKHENWSALFSNASSSVKKIKILAAQLEMCELLCANCHAEHHAPDTTMPMCLSGKKLDYLSQWVQALRHFFHKD